MEVTAQPQPVRWETAGHVALAPSKRHLRPAKLAIAAGLAVLIVSTIGMLRGVEPFATWYYQFSWYSVLLLCDGVLALTGTAGRGVKGEFLLLGRGWHLVTLLGWSAVAWFFYELLNFRLQNWYYILVPEDRAVRWVATSIAFATVLPAVLISEAMLNAVGFARNIRWKPLKVTPAFVNRLQITGAAVMALVMIFPQYFFALVWGASMLVIEPTVYRRARDRSLLHDLEQGKPGRLLRLLAGGALIGLLWEMLNIRARAKWIYTVPFLEEFKLFEMPVPGFLGFPPFAVECFIIWQALICAGVAVPRFGAAFPLPRPRRIAAAFGALVFCLITLTGMDMLTFTSFKPKLAEIPGVPAAELQRAGYDAFRLASSTPGLVAADIGSDRASAQEWIEAARLVTLRGIGTNNLEVLHSVGIRTVEQLAAAHPPDLIRRIEAATKENWVDARIRVWVRGARRTIAE